MNMNARAILPFLALAIAGTVVAGCGQKPAASPPPAPQAAIPEPAPVVNPEDGLRESLGQIDTAMIDMQAASQILGEEGAVEFSVLRNELASRQEELADMLAKWKSATPEERTELEERIAEAVKQFGETMTRVTGYVKEAGGEHDGSVEPPTP